jgi:hypothetical protein
MIPPMTSTGGVSRAIAYQHFLLLSPLFLFAGGIFPRFLNSAPHHVMSVTMMCALSNGIRPMVRIMQTASMQLAYKLEMI